MSTDGLFLYDGDCAFCSRCAEFAVRIVRNGVSVRPWQQTDVQALGLTPAECASAVQWVAPGEPTKSGPEAIARLLRASNGAFGLWRLGGVVLSLPPIRWVARPLYRWVAANRHRMPGGTATCAARGGPSRHDGSTAPPR